MTIAQVTTGGGIVIPPYAITVPMTEKIIQQRLNSYIQQLKKRESLCHNGEKIIIHDDLLKIYMGLSIQELSNQSKEACLARDQVLACINDQKTQKMFLTLNQKNGLKNYLKRKHKINDEFADKMIHFFSEMGKQKDR